MSASQPAEPATVEDIIKLHRLCLGRTPHADEMAAHLDHELLDVARCLIASPEFALHVHAACPESAAPETDDDMSDDLPSWLQCRFGVVLPSTSCGRRAALVLLLKTVLPLWTAFRRRFGRDAPELLTRLAMAHGAEAISWRGFIDVCSEQLIRGWVLRQPDMGPVRLALYFNDFLLLTTEASLFRRDVAEATGGSGLCGFEFHPRIGPHLLRHPRLVLTLRDLDTGRQVPLSRELERLSAPDVAAFAASHAPGQLPDAGPRPGNAAMANFLATAALPLDHYALFRALNRNPAPPRRTSGTPATISVVVPMRRARHDGPPAAIVSLRQQTHPHWEAVLVTSDAPSPGATWAEDDPRVTVVSCPGDADEATLCNRGLDRASGQWVMVVAADDELDPAALAWFACAAQTTAARVLYADEARFETFDDRRRFVEARLKPAFDYDLFLETRHLGRPVCILRDEARAVGGFRSLSMPASDVDLLLRLIEHGGHNAIVHIPLVLIDRPIDNGGDANARPRTEAGAPVAATTEAADGLDNVVAAHLHRSGAHAALVPTEDHDVVHRAHRHRQVRWTAARGGATMAIVIQTRDRIDLLQPCVDSIRRSLAAPSSTELIIVDHQSEDPLTMAYLAALAAEPNVRVIPFEGEFNWSRANNVAAASTGADLLLFMNNDVEVVTPAFDLVLRGLLDRPDVGVVGALLLYEDGSIQHAGTVVGVGGTAAHLGVGQLPVDGGYLGMHGATHAVGAVTGAFLAVRRHDFERVGGLDDTALKVTFNDVDLCLKIRALGLRVLYTPAIQCFHYESATRGASGGTPVDASRVEHESQTLASRWRDEVRFDPFYNPTFYRAGGVHAAIQMPSADTVMAYLERQVQWRECALSSGHRLRDVDSHAHEREPG